MVQTEHPIEDISFPISLVEAAGVDPHGNSRPPVIVPLLEWECRYPHKYYVVAQKSNGEDFEFEPAAHNGVEMDICNTPNAPSNPNCFIANNFRLAMYPYSSPEFLPEMALPRYNFEDSGKIINYTHLQSDINYCLFQMFHFM